MKEIKSQNHSLTDRREGGNMEKENNKEFGQIDAFPHLQEMRKGSFLLGPSGPIKIHEEENENNYFFTR